MASRVLLVTFKQALRGIVLSLLPITTITLIGWSLAGSQTGNTSDPLKASIWFWLAAHLIPFQLKLAPAFISTFFNYLPIGGVILPILAIRSSFQRAAAELNNERAARSFLTLWYGLIATLAALMMQSDTVKPIIYLAPIYAGAIALISTVNLKNEFFKPFRYLGYLILITFGLAALGISISLALHFNVVKSLTSIIEAGWIGGLLLVLLQLLYLPNMVVAVISYFSGLGFSIGPSTLVSPLTFKLNGIPAIPLLGALPTQKHPVALILIAIPFLFITLNLIRSVRGSATVGNGLAGIWNSSWIFIPLALLIGYQSSGTLISKSVGDFGVRWWTLLTIFIVGQLLVTILFYLIPHGIKALVKR
jgi:hypothetical protein